MNCLNQDQDTHKIDIKTGFLKLNSKPTTPVLTEILKDEIWIVDNFLTKEECDYLIQNEMR